MPFNVLLGDLIGAILAPVFEAILALLAPVFAFMFEILAALLAPVFAPILELFLWIFTLISGAIVGLVWALLTTLGLARYASGISRGAYLLSASCLLFLLIGLFQFLTGTPTEQNLVSETGGVIAMIVAGLGLIIGIGAARSPDERIREREARQARKQEKASEGTSEAADHRQPGKAGAIFKAVVFGAVISATFFWFWPSSEPKLPECTTTDRLRQLASEVMSERGSEPTAEALRPAGCR